MKTITTSTKNKPPTSQYLLEASFEQTRLVMELVSDTPSYLKMHPKHKGINSHIPETELE